MAVPKHLMLGSSKLSGRVGDLRRRCLIRKQDPNMCVMHHKEIIRKLVDPEKRLGWKKISSRVPTKVQLKQALTVGPVLLHADNIARKGSKYLGHHAVIVVDFSGDGESVSILDCDDTVVAGADYIYDIGIDDLLGKISVPTNTNLEGEVVQVDPVAEQLGDTWWTTFHDLWNGKKEEE